jgi:DNA-binding MarR family transcriptional regulator
VDTPRFSPTIALLTLARAAEVDVARILEPAGLSVRKLLILQRLAAAPGATPGDLARTVGVTTDEVAPILRAMTTTGLVKRGRDGALSATPQGEDALNSVTAALAALDERTFEGRDGLSGELFEATQRTYGEPQD